MSHRYLILLYPQSKRSKNDVVGTIGTAPHGVTAPVEVGGNNSLDETTGAREAANMAGGGEARPSFEETYQLGKELGHGSFSTVREGVHKVEVGRSSVFGLSRFVFS